VTEIVLIAAIASIAPTVTSIAGLFVAIANARKNVDQNNEILDKAQVIHGLVNSEMAKVRAELVTAQEEIKSLKKMINEP
jgi:5-bromo-4-chloroindolyl phosphate hydrolysis protein